MDWKILDQLNLSANFVNLLLQNGTIGSIDMADTITDAGLLIDYVISGSYIRSFADLYILISYNNPPGSYKNPAGCCFVCGEFIPLGSLRQICENYAFKNRHFS